MKSPLIHVSAAVFSAALFVVPLGAQTPAASPTGGTSGAGGAGQPNEAEMMKQMMELSKLNENHKLLADLAGSWTYDVKMWMAPGAPPAMSKGTAVRKAIMDGRFFAADFDGTMKMPDEKGQMKDFNFKGTALEGYDNVKKKFVATWADNMGTGVMTTEGTYDPNTKTFTYQGDYEMMPGMKAHIREVIKVVDQDHHTLEWYENSHGAEAKTMEINYTRKK